MAVLIDYYVSLNSPWTHLGAARIEALAAQHGAELRIWPVDFGTIFAGSGGLPLPKRSPQRQACTVFRQIVTLYNVMNNLSADADAVRRSPGQHAMPHPERRR